MLFRSEALGRYIHVILSCASVIVVFCFGCIAFTSLFCPPVFWTCRHVNINVRNPRVGHHDTISAGIVSRGTVTIYSVRQSSLVCFIKHYMLSLCPVTHPGMITTSVCPTSVTHSGHCRGQPSPCSRRRDLVSRHRVQVHSRRRSTDSPAVRSPTQRHSVLI